MKEILVVLRLITNSRNLKELRISVSYCQHIEALFGECFSFVLNNFFQELRLRPSCFLSINVQQGSSTTHAAMEATDLDFWEKECPSHCSFERLIVVKMSEMSGAPHEMEFIKFLLENSPVLEIMSIMPCPFVTDGRLNMLTELVRFRRASARAEILFSQG